MKRMLQIGMIVLVLMGTIGIPFYQHTCLHENRVLKSVFLPSNECSEEHLKEEQPACCATSQVSESNETAISDDCCLDEVSNWQFSFFFFQDVHPVFSEVLEEVSILSFFSHFEIIWVNKDQQLFSGSDPPNLLTSLERLTHLCIWRL
ncbi:hypothetical protein [Fluviicola taffensis]|uniref:Uncharacterized protein n=1 Tax=Fluviicola taffensis (strain DSM 16823 / NCIMB 13979 / RW262) TaxID=755732 RepID=F2IJI5_FLUTR|nr:hypothetical protein [Fluviicola taffensis]AEA42873.1 hypothetical protein Fluta_0872 [Fluviicola taffensis DSM 16823]